MLCVFENLFAVGDSLETALFELRNALIELFGGVEEVDGNEEGVVEAFQQCAVLSEQLAFLQTLNDHRGAKIPYLIM